jgi:hypothetical protein
MKPVKRSEDSLRISDPVDNAKPEHRQHLPQLVLERQIGVEPDRPVQHARLLLM